jgi:hypothetical protein
MRTHPKPLGKATYVASRLDLSWLQNEQRKLYARSMQTPAFANDICGEPGA